MNGQWQVNAWKARYSGTTVSEAKRLKVLEDENAKRAERDLPNRAAPSLTCVVLTQPIGTLTHPKKGWASPSASVDSFCGKNLAPIRQSTLLDTLSFKKDARNV